MFPDTLDNASVLYYTPPGSYGVILYPSGEIAGRIAFLAICQYPTGGEYYLFGCSAAYEVVSDWPCDSVQECMNAAQFSRERNHSDEIIWIKA